MIDINAAPRHWVMVVHTSSTIRRLSDLSGDELLARVSEYRAMAATANSADIRDALIMLTEQCEARRVALLRPKDGGSLTNSY